MGKKIIGLTKEGEVQFANVFLEEYLARGFGALSKREIDVLMMSLLTNFTNLADISNFDLSVKLKLTEAKIKNLKYEANLKYRKDLDTYIKKKFIQLLGKANLKVVKKDMTIVLSIEDTFLRNALSSIVKDNGSFIDSSFNSEIVKISIKDMIDILSIFYSESEQKEIENEIKKEIENANKMDFKQLFNKFVEKAIEGVGDEVGKVAVKLSIASFTGGLYPLVDAIKSLLQEK